jgi:cysteine desulfurase
LKISPSDVSRQAFLSAEVWTAMIQFPIYMDNNATTRPDPRVVEAMLPYLTSVYGNAASHSHSYGWQAESAVDTARHEIAQLIGADGREIVFTSGATEADNLALKGVAESYADQGDHIITVSTEHKAVLDSADHLQRQGKRVTFLSVDHDGRIDLDEFRDALSETTVLVSVMMANNETGTLQPIAEIGQICRSKGIVFHTDATQAVGKINVDVETLSVDLMSLTAHKMYGPKGVGALYVRRKNPRVRLTSQMDGGRHERGFRSGTLNVPGIVGFGKAAELCRLELCRDIAHTQILRDALEEGIRRHVPEMILNGHPAERLPNTLNVSLASVGSDAMMAGLPDVALSSGSACSSASIEPSHVLKAMGLTDAQAHSSLRFGVSRYTTSEEVEYVIGKIAYTVERLRGLASEKPLVTL